MLEKWEGGGEKSEWFMALWLKREKAPVCSAGARGRGA